jgi:hypothetical protein
MNKRIKELAKQVDACYIPRYDMWQMDTETMEKFAELIVRECMEQVWYTREDSINGNVSEVIKQRIEQHFGVEE